MQQKGPLKSGRLNKKWLRKAKELTQLLAAAPNPAARAVIFNNIRNNIWKEVRDWLLSLSHGKCWFSEAPDSFSYWEVEHFRPKAGCKRKVGQRKDSYEEGYWWLAYDWKNYRISGKVGNTKKGVFFPLMPLSVVASYGGLDWNNEVPVFLDPISPADPSLLDFRPDGKVVAHHGATAGERNRVRITVNHLRLDYDKLEEARAKVWLECQRLIDECRELAAAKVIGSSERTQIEEKHKRLRAMRDKSAPFSMTAVACLRKNGGPWASLAADG